MDVLARIQKNWNQEAVKLCRELMVDDPSAPMPHVLMAIALDQQFQPNGAARSCWEAVSRRANGRLIEQEIIDALQDYFAVASQPELADERYAQFPPISQRMVLVRALRCRMRSPDGPTPAPGQAGRHRSPIVKSYGRSCVITTPT